MTDASSAPATKQDISLLMETLGQMMQNIVETEQRLDQKIDRLDGKIDGVEQRLLVRFEDLQHNVLGALNDVRTNDAQVADHERRIVRLEHAAAAR